MQIVLNGESREIKDGAILLDLLTGLNLPQDAVVAELNGDIVDRADFAARRLAPGDVIELVRFVGGG